jgi:hypothetical protein
VVAYRRAGLFARRRHALIWLVRGRPRRTRCRTVRLLGLNLVGGSVQDGPHG